MAAAAATAVVLAACGSDSDLVLRQPSPEPPPVLVPGEAALSGFDPASGSVVFEAPGAVASPDGSRVVRTVDEGSSTTVVELDPLSGAALDSHPMEGTLVARAVSASGVVVLAPPRRAGTSAYVPESRVRSTIAVLDLEDGSEETFTLDGNVEPEAISTDGSTLFVIQYLPAVEPERYRVREVDLVTGEIGDVFDREDELQEAMGGTARTQAWDHDGRRLYTLYGQEGNAFVHVLSLDEGWAHCVDLPSGFAGQDGAASLALSADGGRLYVSDAAAGALAEVDTEALEVSRTAALDRTGPGRLVSAVLGDGRVLVAGGDVAVTLDANQLRVVDRWELEDAVTALVSDRRSGVLLAALVDRVVELDPRTGEVVRTLPIDPPPLEDGRSEIQCAC